MSSQEETMRIVAEVVDKFSKPLQDLRKQLKDTGGDAKNKQLERSYEDIRKSVRGLRDEVKGGLTPALAVFGLTAFSVGGAMAAVATSIRGFASSTNALSYLRRETGLTIDTMRQFESFAERMGSTPDAMRAGFSSFARNAQEFRKGIGSTFTTLWNEGDAGLKNFLLSLRKVGDNEEMLKRVLKFSDQIPDPQLREKYLNAFGVPPELGRVTGAERENIFAQIAKNIGKTGKEAEEAAKQFEAAMSGIKEAWRGWQLELGSSGALDAVRQVMVDLRAFASENREEFGKGITQFFRDVGPVAKEFGSILKGIGQGIHWLQEVADKLNEQKAASKDVKPWIDIPNYTRNMGAGNKSVEELSKQRHHGPSSLFGPTFGERFTGEGSTSPNSDLAKALEGLRKKFIDQEDQKKATKEGASEGAKEGASQGVQEGIRKMMLEGRPGGDFGGGARVWNASYGGGGGGGYSGGGGGGGGDGMGRGVGGGGVGGSEDAPTGHVNLPKNKRETAAIVADEWGKAGMSKSGIAGLMANIKSESGFNPTLRHPDQPKFGGEAHFAHGLYQEGGTEWNHYAAWLKKNYPGSDWKDARLQSRFAAENLKKNYSKVWARMTQGSKEAAADAYLRGYLKPSAPNVASRSSQYRRGVPGVDTYTGGQQAPESSLPAITLGTIRQRLGGGQEPINGNRPWLDQNREADRDRLNRETERNRLFDSAANSGVLGGGPNLNGNAKLQIDLNGFPKGTKTQTQTDGIFSDVKLNRGRSMPLASEEE